jgi:sugar phosphate isomerase/epimerase
MNNNPKVLGAQLYTLREHCRTIPEIAATLARVRAIGYTAVQVSGIGPVDAREAGKVLADSGLTVAATHMGWWNFVHETDKVIQTHKWWNCVHSAIGSLGAEYYSPEGLDRFLAELAVVAPKLAAEGIDFSFHNHCIEFIKFDGRLMLDLLYERTSPQTLKAEIDTYWIQAGGGDPAAWIRKIGPRQPILHLKDYGMAPGEWQPRTLEVGQGNLDWPGILAAAKEVGVQWYLIEQDNTYGRDPFESLKMSYEFLAGLGLS